MRAYFDASAFAKGYLREPGTDRVRELLVSADCVGMCVLGLTELISALCRQVREGKLSKREYRGIRAMVLADISDTDMVQLTGAVVDRSINLLERSALHALDALHIASAMEWEADCFISSDRQQLEVAQQAGLECIIV